MVLAHISDKIQCETFFKTENTMLRNRLARWELFEFFSHTSLPQLPTFLSLSLPALVSRRSLALKRSAGSERGLIARNLTRLFLSFTNSAAMVPRRRCPQTLPEALPARPHVCPPRSCCLLGLDFLNCVCGFAFLSCGQRSVICSLLREAGKP